MGLQRISSGYLGNYVHYLLQDDCVVPFVIIIEKTVLAEKNFKLLCIFHWQIHLYPSIMLQCLGNALLTFLFMCLNYTKLLIIKVLATWKAESRWLNQVDAAHQLLNLTFMIVLQLLRLCPSYGAK